MKRRLTLTPKDRERDREREQGILSAGKQFVLARPQNQTFTRSGLKKGEKRSGADGQGKKAFIRRKTINFSWKGEKDVLSVIKGKGSSKPSARKGRELPKKMPLTVLKLGGPRFKHVTEKREHRKLKTLFLL